MATAEDELQHFNLFVRQRLSEAEPANISLVELMEEWQLRNPTDEQIAENDAAANAAIDDFRNGDRGKPAGELTRRLRETPRASME